ncbi:MAG TPA: hypothetical protein VHS26_04795, partial [Solirubrobacteraceae bacterium]|nr:hypothetical protein [Solirubrobacteraceae bacterium]
MIAVGAVAIDFAFRSLLIDQARLNLAQTADQIENIAREAATFPFAEETAPLTTLADRATL